MAKFSNGSGLYVSSHYSKGLCLKNLKIPLILADVRSIFSELERIFENQPF